eukprot:c29594_g1_i1 orf=216-428(+)
MCCSKTRAVWLPLWLFSLYIFPLLNAPAARALMVGCYQHSEARLLQTPLALVATPSLWSATPSMLLFLPY